MKWVCVQIDRENTIKINVYNLKESNSTFHFCRTCFSKVLYRCLVVGANKLVPRGLVFGCL